MKTAILAALVLSLTACASNAPNYGSACNREFERTFWASHTGGGVDSAAWANLKAHTAAEACQRAK